MVREVSALVSGALLCTFEQVPVFVAPSTQLGNRRRELFVHYGSWDRKKLKLEMCFQISWVKHYLKAQFCS